MFTTGLWDSRKCLLQVYKIQNYVYSRLLRFKNMFNPGLQDSRVYLFPVSKKCLSQVIRFNNMIILGYKFYENVYSRFIRFKNMFTPGF